MIAHVGNGLGLPFPGQSARSERGIGEQGRDEPADSEVPVLGAIRVEIGEEVQLVAPEVLLNRFAQVVGNLSEYCCTFIVTDQLLDLRHGPRNRRIPSRWYRCKSIRPHRGNA